ncbi:MAG TPA: hypothetical protein VMX58_06435 [Patescibacteria group bacterium]|nr:hypothetical protein [Patescibacteria group bacterium]
MEFPCERDLPKLLLSERTDWYLHIRGSVRIDLPRYRVRGLCTIRATPAGDVRIDFHHSSLFGSYREDATIFLRGGKLGILDRERGAFFENDTTLAILRDHLGFNLFPDDIAHVLLLACPDCAEVDSSGISRSSGSGTWRFSGIWRDRRITIEGRDGGEPTYFRQCRKNESLCYVVNYRYDGGGTVGRYPSGITISREYGSERLVLTVRDVKREYVGDEVFGLFDSLLQ